MRVIAVGRVGAEGVIFWSSVFCVKAIKYVRTKSCPAVMQVNAYARKASDDFIQ